MTDREDEQAHEYTDQFVAKLELLWGEGFLSPGGEGAVAEVVALTDFRDKDVLDIGCGIGGVDVLLVEQHGARSVLGIDVESPVLDRARARSAEQGLEDRLTFQLVEPGPLPLEDAAFDVVFSKDAMIHIPDKPALFAEAFRVLRSDGVFIASDWLKGRDEPYSADMTEWVERSGLHFEMASLGETGTALESAGFVDVALFSRNEWYRQEGRRELARIQGELRERALELLGREGYENWVRLREKMIEVLDSGEFCPAHLRARKPD